MKILVIEGQGNLGLVYKLLIEPLEKTHKFECVRRAWNDITFPQADIIIGHSLGGQTAINVASACGKYLITLDPRHQSNASFFDFFFFRWQKNFRAPKTVVAFNFTQPFWLPGYRVDGATNKSLFTNHLALPGHPEVRDCLLKILAGKL